MRYLSSAIVILALFALLIGAVACSSRHHAGESLMPRAEGLDGSPSLRVNGSATG